MVQLEVNGQRHAFAASSMEELVRRIDAEIAEGQVICALRVNGQEIAPSRLAEFDVAAVRSVEVQSAPPRVLAREAVGNTIEWIGRICEALESVSRDYRLGHERAATDRLASVIDALQVLVSLLGGIRQFLGLEGAARGELSARWTRAELELRESVEGLARDMQSGDPVQIADRTGYALPRSLRDFRGVLEDLPR
jgi:hypothetical protein